MSGVSSPISRKPLSPTPPLTLFARTVHPRHRSTAILPPLLAQSLNLDIPLRRKHAYQRHHPLHVPTPSRTQPVRFRLLHHRVHCHRRTFHERILRKSRHRIRVAANIAFPICIPPISCMAGCEDDDCGVIVPFVVGCESADPTPIPRPMLGPFSAAVAAPPLIIPMPCSIPAPAGIPARRVIGPAMDDI